MHIRKGRDPLVAFVATLGYSRASWVHFINNERAETLSNCWIDYCTTRILSKLPARVTG
ncbi:hypothetical protein EDC26_103260 [Paralcaligenes ureilyticus]|uniref:Integrase-like protein n=1 Tax=Paralcaligenes ureilyticus TaxID=627131 RepID=A0A4R3M810_9BURK|nr:hypothetical protein EDC26_103260 [Paralcaligenes ureilyticus]